jgi:hypothetical protein
MQSFGFVDDPRFTSSSRKIHRLRTGRQKHLRSHRWCYGPCKLIVARGIGVSLGGDRCGWHHSCFSLGIEATGSCSSAQQPASGSRPLYAGRRLPSHQAPDRLIPEGSRASGFDDIRLLYEASSVGSLSFVSRTHICSRSFIELWPQRSPPVFTAAAWSDLRPAPESQSRRAHPHLSRSLRQSLYAPFLASPQHTVIKTVAADRSNQPLRETGPRRRETSRRIVLAIKMQRAARKREKASAADSEPFPSILFYVHFPTRTTCNASWFPSASCRLASPSR